MDWAQVSAICAVISSLGGGLWAVHNSISKRFNSVDTKFDHVDNKVDKLENSIVSRLDNHETQDVQRFGNMSDGIWDLRVRMAAKEGVHPLTINAKS